MPVVVITPPDPIVSFEDAKAHLRLDDEVEKDYVEGLVAAATAWIDGPGGWIGRAFGVQMLEWRLSDWPCNDGNFPVMPMIEVESITYVDPDGVEQTWDHSTPLWFENMPATRGRPGDIRIRYWAGYGKRDVDDPTKWVNAVPPQIKVAILLYVGAWFENREEVVIGASVDALPAHLGADALLTPFRIYS